MKHHIKKLDKKHRRELFLFFTAITFAIFIVSHDFEYIKDYADKVVLLNKKVLKNHYLTE